MAPSHGAGGLDVALTLVSAPAGNGKSVLVSQWVEQLEHPSASLSLDNGRNESVAHLARVGDAGALLPMWHRARMQWDVGRVQHALVGHPRRGARQQVRPRRVRAPIRPVIWSQRYFHQYVFSRLVYY